MSGRAAVTRLPADAMHSMRLAQGTGMDDNQYKAMALAGFVLATATIGRLSGKGLLSIDDAIEIHDQALLALEENAQPDEPVVLAREFLALALARLGPRTP